MIFKDKREAYQTECKNRKNKNKNASYNEILNFLFEYTTVFVK